MRSLLRSVVLMSLACAAVVAHTFAQTELLYDVDFSTPPHIVGALPTTGTGSAPRDVPTVVQFGDPTVVTQLGALTDQPCSFGNGTTGYDQLEFGVDPSHPGGFAYTFDEYHVQMTLLIEEYGTGELFKILFDCPTVNNIEFHDDGTIRVYPGGGTIGHFTFGAPLYLDVTLDVIGGEWIIYLDGAHAYSGPLDGDRLRSFRMNLNGNQEDSRVAVDELRVYGGPIFGLSFLYHVDFNSPPHMLGSLPVTGGGPPPRKTPTEIRFGDPTVVPALGALALQPCAFGNGTTGYDQFQFDVDPSAAHGFSEAYDFYMFSCDVVVEEFLTDDEFEIILDCPTVHKIMFMPDQTVQVYPGHETIGHYAFGVPIDVRAGLDIVNGEWTIWLGGDWAYTGPATAEMLRSFRLHLDGLNAAHAAAVDEVYLWGWGQSSDVAGPEPPLWAATARTFPNPTANGSWIEWELPATAPVQVEILTVTGRCVWSAGVPATAAGANGVRWNGEDACGRPAPSGVYFARVRSGDRLLGVRTIVLRR